MTIDTDWLRAHTPRGYVYALTGESPPAGTLMHCPLPDHDDRTPSFAVYSDHWFCFGCDRGGDIVNFGAALWGLDTRRDFAEIVARLKRALASRTHAFKFAEPVGYDRDRTPECDVCGLWPGEHFGGAAA